MPHGGLETLAETGLWQGAKAGPAGAGILLDREIAEAA